MSKKVYINQQAVVLDPSQMLQSGGEGMVFQWGQTAVKLYHQPQQNHQGVQVAVIQLPILLVHQIPR